MDRPPAANSIAFSRPAVLRHRQLRQLQRRSITALTIDPHHRQRQADRAGRSGAASAGSLLTQPKWTFYMTWAGMAGAAAVARARQSRSAARRRLNRRGSHNATPDELRQIIAQLQQQSAAGGRGGRARRRIRSPKARAPIRCVISSPGFKPGAKRAQGDLRRPLLLEARRSDTEIKRVGGAGSRRLPHVTWTPRRLTSAVYDTYIRVLNQKPTRRVQSPRSSGSAVDFTRTPGAANVRRS